MIERTSEQGFNSEQGEGFREVLRDGILCYELAGEPLIVGLSTKQLNKVNDTYSEALIRSFDSDHAAELYARRVEINLEAADTKDVVHIVDEAYLAADHKNEKTDALITQLRGVPLLSVATDCPSVLVYHGGVKPTLGIAHSGWKSARLGVVPKMLRMMSEVYAVNPKEVQVVITPYADQIGRAHV